MNRDHLNVVFIGHIDAGKSTLAGQILFVTVSMQQRLGISRRQGVVQLAGRQAGRARRHAVEGRCMQGQQLRDRPQGILAYLSARCRSLQGGVDKRTIEKYER